VGCILLCLIPVTIMVLVKVSTTSNFVVHQEVQPYGVYHGDVALTSDALNLLAFICDIKEVSFIDQCRTSCCIEFLDLL
jgi:hypothetical protein